MYFLSYNCFSGARESAAESAAKLTPVNFNAANYPRANDIT